MRIISFLFAYLACAGHGRRVQSKTEQKEPNSQTFLADLLLANQLAAAFQVGGQPIKTSRSVQVTGQRGGAEHLRMGENEHINPLASMQSSIDERAQRLHMLENYTRFIYHLAEDRSDKIGAALAEISQHAHVAPSSKHGLGLFASTNLKKGTIVSFYPVHGLVHASTGQAVAVYESYFSEPDDLEYSSYRLNLAHHSFRDLQIGCRPNGNISDRLGWLAHRSNDAALLSELSAAALLQYWKTSLLECNCASPPLGNAAPLMVLVTTRDVLKDEELLHSYGAGYYAAPEDQENVAALAAGLKKKHKKVSDDILREQKGYKTYSFGNDLHKLVKKYKTLVEYCENEYEKLVEHAKKYHSLEYSKISKVPSSSELFPKPKGFR